MIVVTGEWRVGDTGSDRDGAEEAGERAGASLQNITSAVHDFFLSLFKQIFFFSQPARLASRCSNGWGTHFVGEKF